MLHNPITNKSNRPTTTKWSRLSTYIKLKVIKTPDLFKTSLLHLYKGFSTN